MRKKEKNIRERDRYMALMIPFLIEREKERDRVREKERERERERER